MQTFKDSKVTLIVNALYTYIVAMALLAPVNTVHTNYNQCIQTCGT